MISKIRFYLVLLPTLILFQTFGGNQFGLQLFADGNEVSGNELNSSPEEIGDVLTDEELLFSIPISDGWKPVSNKRGKSIFSPPAERPFLEKRVNLDPKYYRDKIVGHIWPIGRFNYTVEEVAERMRYENIHSVFKIETQSIKIDGHQAIVDEWVPVSRGNKDGVGMVEYRIYVKNNKGNILAFKFIIANVDYKIMKPDLDQLVSKIRFLSYEKPEPKSKYKVYGRLTSTSGNCMPIVDESKFVVEKLSRTLVIRKLAQYKRPDPFMPGLVLESETELVTKTHSDNNGNFELELPPGEYSLFYEDHGKEESVPDFFYNAFPILVVDQPVERNLNIVLCLAS